MVKVRECELTRDFLREAFDINAEVRIVRGMGHEANLEVVECVGEWMKERYINEESSVTSE